MRLSLARSSRAGMAGADDPVVVVDHLGTVDLEVVGNARGEVVEVADAVDLIPDEAVPLLSIDDSGADDLAEVVEAVGVGAHGDAVGDGREPLHAAGAAPQEGADLADVPAVWTFAHRDAEIVDVENFGKAAVAAHDLPVNVDELAGVEVVEKRFPVAARVGVRAHADDVVELVDGAGLVGVEDAEITVEQTRTVDGIPDGRGAGAVGASAQVSPVHVADHDVAFVDAVDAGELIQQNDAAVGIAQGDASGDRAYIIDDAGDVDGRLARLECPQKRAIAGDRGGAAGDLIEVIEPAGVRGGELVAQIPWFDGDEVVLEVLRRGGSGEQQRCSQQRPEELIE